jgi:hypothetical protein
MAGITRIKITDRSNGRGAYRFDKSENLWGQTNDIYWQVFEYLKMPLEPGYDVIECTKDEFMSGYDIQLGIDIIFKFISQQTSTCQEKILFTKFHSVTIEYYQDWRQEIRGDWFNLKCQYYTVFYDSYDKGSIDDWRILNYAQVQQATAQGRIRWWRNNNKKDGAKADFKYAYFADLPDDVIVCKPGDLMVRKLALF